MNYLFTHWFITISTLIIYVSIVAFGVYLLKTLPKHMGHISSILLTLLVTAISLYSLGYIFLNYSSYSLEAVCSGDRYEHYATGQVVTSEKELSSIFGDSPILLLTPQSICMDGIEYYFPCSAPNVGDWVSIVCKGPRNVVTSYKRITDDTEKVHTQFTVDVGDYSPMDNKSKSETLSKIGFVSSCILGVLFCVLKLWGWQIAQQLQRKEKVIPGMIHYSWRGGLIFNLPYIFALIVLLICSLYDKWFVFMGITMFLVWGFLMFKAAHTSVRLCGNNVIISCMNSRQRISIREIEKTCKTYLSRYDYVYIIFYHNGKRVEFVSRSYVGIEAFEAKLQRRKQKNA